MRIKPEHIGKRVSLVTTKGKPLVVVLTKKPSKIVIREIGIKWPNWLEKVKKDAAQEKEPKTKETPTKESGEGDS